ncbi:MAG: iron ABC transporter permease [Syntrophomonas sp.]
MQWLQNGKNATPNRMLKRTDRGLLVNPLSYLSLNRLVYALVVVSLLIFIAWPVLAVLKESLFQDGTLTWHNYRTLFTGRRYLLLNSMLVAVLSTLLAVFLGLATAVYLYNRRSRGKNLIYLTLLLSMVSPPFIGSLAYIMLFGRRGLITFQLLGINWNPYGWHGIVLMQGIAHTALAALIISGVLHSMDREVEMASRDLGASPAQTLWHITLPRAWPGIAIAAMLSFILSLADFGTPIIIGGNFTVLATEAYLQAIGLYNLHMAAAMGVLLLIPSIIIFAFYRKYMNRIQLYSARTAGNPEAGAGLPGLAQLFLAVIVWGFVGFQLLQYATILAGAITQTWGVDYSFTLRHIEIICNSQMGSFYRSLLYAFIAALSGSLIGIYLSYMLEWKKPRGYRGVDFLATLPYMIPGPFLGIAYIMAFHSGPLVLTGTAFIVIANCVFRQLPISTKAGAAVLSQIQPELESCARDLGASEWQAFKDVVLPQLKPAFLVSFIDTFNATMTTIGAIIFLVTPGALLLTVEMFNQIKTGRIGLAAVMANMIILSTVLVNLAVAFFLWRGKINWPGKSKKEARYVPAAN